MIQSHKKHHVFSADFASLALLLKHHTGLQAISIDVEVVINKELVSLFSDMLEFTTIGFRERGESAVNLTCGAIWHVVLSSATACCKTIDPRSAGCVGSVT